MESWKLAPEWKPKNAPEKTNATPMGWQFWRVLTLPLKLKFGEAQEIETNVILFYQATPVFQEAGSKNCGLLTKPPLKE